MWLQVIAEIAKRKPDLRAELIGDGVDRPALQSLIQQMGLEDAVRLHGHLPRAEVLARMLESKILLHTSNFESFGFVLAEAAMNGCRVVSTPVGIAPQFSAIGRTREELLKQVMLALAQPLLSAPITPFMMEDAAQQYLRVYHTTALMPISLPPLSYSDSP